MASSSTLDENSGDSKGQNNTWQLFDQIKCEPDDTIKIEVFEKDEDEENPIYDPPLLEFYGNRINDGSDDSKIEPDVQIKTEETMSEKCLEIFKSHFCESCDKTFSTPHVLSRHIRLVHTGETFYECDVCHAKYVHHRSFVTHKKNHHGFSNKSASSSSEPKVKSHTCGHCNQSFFSISTLNDHNTRVHNGEESRPKFYSPYACDTCGKVFRNRKKLDKHVTIHSDEKPHKCEHCGKCFRLANKLNEHIKIHSGQKSHECKTCGKGFHRKDSLDVHLRVHTGDKPFKCSNCNECFSFRSAFNRHVASHEEDNQFKKSTSLYSFEIPSL